eukprot:TRINITY_DN9744_c0_g1_i6.p1 TRINITY_DN9744_c0_g1~~TRINITY_DN9744_c0_g1_i6.p1  ORF type:complete len:179 (+),score=61.25 TRINITY_DN9744_c0_g1_i6:187-723(+)
MGEGAEPIEGAEARLREAREEARKRLRWCYAMHGPERYGEWLDKELSEWPCLAAEVAEQRRRMGEGAEPFDGAEEALKEFAERDRRQNKRYWVSSDPEGHSAYLKSNLDYYRANAPVLLPEIEEQLRRLAEGREPFEGAEELRREYEEELRRKHEEELAGDEDDENSKGDEGADDEDG